MHDVDDLPRALAMARDHAAAVGRATPLDVAFMPLGRETYTTVAEPSRVVEAAAELAALGVTYLTMQFPVTTRRELSSCIERFGRDAIGEIAALTARRVV